MPGFDPAEFVAMIGEASSRGARLMLLLGYYLNSDDAAVAAAFLAAGPDYRPITPDAGERRRPWVVVTNDPGDEPVGPFPHEVAAEDYLAARPLLRDAGGRAVRLGQP